MTAIHETAYPRLKPSFNAQELQEIFAPTDEEIVLMEAKTKKTLLHSRLGFMLTLKYYQCLGRPVSMRKMQESVKKYIAGKLGIEQTVDLIKYNKLTRINHLKVIRAHLGINDDFLARRTLMKKTALAAATNKENLADIVNCLLEALIKEYFEIPAFKGLVRLARAARTVTNNDYYLKIFAALTDEQKWLIDEIINGVDGSEKTIASSWASLKQEPKKATPKNIKSFISYVNRLQSLRQKVRCDLDAIAPARLEQLRDEAQIADIADMKKMRAIKRYALVVIFINMKAATALDDLVQVFMTWIRKIESQAKHNLEQYRINQGNKTDELIVVLYKTLLALKNNPQNEDKIQAIEIALDGKIDDRLEECKEHLGLTGDNHLVWMLKPYRNKRHTLFSLLENMTILSASQDQSLINALKFIMAHRISHKQWIELDPQSNTPQPDLSLLTETWLKIVTGVGKGAIVNKIHRHYYEIAIMSVLADDMQCGDVYLDDAFVFSDPNKQLISLEQLAQERDDYCSLINIPNAGAPMVRALQLRLRQAAQKVDAHYPNNPSLLIENGMPVLKKAGQKQDHPDLEKIQQMIMGEMPLISIVDVIIDVENWLQLSRYFKPLSGFESKMTNYPSRFVATTLAYGSNMGPTQAERSLVKFSRKQIAWLFNHHANDTRLLKTLQFIINQFHRFGLPLRWGSGESQSVDGTFVDMYKQNLLAAHHIRYGRYGGVAYYHISDQYIALYSNFISCGVHESVYLLDGIIANDSDIRPNKVHGDSWAQTEALFGLSLLLAIMVMPRIKQFKHLYYYKASCDDYYDNIDSLFTHKPIDWELIETHFDDMLRVAISIHKGKIKASTILRRLCSKSRKNKLYFAFRELGRVERTIFLLRYINEPELRAMIQAATCKSEEFNEFIAWIRFGGGGVIQDNMRANQNKGIPLKIPSFFLRIKSNKLLHCT